MGIYYKCCFCRKNYEWYEGLYENPNYNEDDARKARRRGEEYEEEAGTYVKANGFTLCRIDPINDSIDAKEPISVTNLDSNLSVYLNVCRDCMRKILDNLYPEGNKTNAWNY